MLTAQVKMIIVAAAEAVAEYGGEVVIGNDHAIVVRGGSHERVTRHLKLSAAVKDGDTVDGWTIEVTP